MTKRWKKKMVEKYLRQRERLKNINESDHLLRKATNVMQIAGSHKSQTPGATPGPPMTPMKLGD